MKRASFFFYTVGVGGGGANITDCNSYRLMRNGTRVAVCVIISAGSPRHEPRAVEEEDAWCELMKSRWWKGYRPLTKHRRPNKAEPGVGFNWKEASSRSSGSGAASFDVWGCRHEILMAARQHTERVTDTNEGRLFRKTAAMQALQRERSILERCLITWPAAQAHLSNLEAKCALPQLFTH